VAEWLYDTYGDYVVSARRRIADAWELLEHPTWEPDDSDSGTRHLAAAYYLAGYAVECAIKSYFMCLESSRLTLSELISRHGHREQLVEKPHSLHRWWMVTDLDDRLAALAASGQPQSVSQAERLRVGRSMVFGRWSTAMRYQAGFHPSRGDAAKWIGAADRLYRWIDAERRAREGVR
jgi:hypothetical protein